MEALINYLSDFMNFWTLFDVVVILGLTVLLSRKANHCNYLNSELLFQKALNTEMKLEHLSQLKIKNDQISQTQSDLLTSKQN